MWRLTMTPLKSLAHPEWPYSGSAHEWRGFAEKQLEGYVSPLEKLTAEQWEFIKNSDGPIEIGTVYQKQNLGPELT